MIQPFEFGVVPLDWVAGIEASSAEIWAPSTYVRRCFVESGVPQSRVHVVPNGIDVSVFRPVLDPLPLATRKGFRFLFVGGTIWRKGFDLVLTAYGRAFTAANDVCLVVKDMGVGTFYRGQTAESLVAAFRDRPGAPSIEYRADCLTESEMARLYAACSCLVHPYRGEGFGMPVAEAMACGLPVLVTNGGATDDWCDDATSFQIPARRVELASERVDSMPMAGRPWVLEPDIDALTELLRHLAGRPADADARARSGCSAVRGRLTWTHAAQAAEARLRCIDAEKRR